MAAMLMIVMRSLALLALFTAGTALAGELVDPATYVGNVYGTAPPRAEITLTDSCGVVVRSATASADGSYLINAVPAPYDGADYTLCAGGVCRDVHVLPGAVMALQANFAGDGVATRYRHEIEEPASGRIRADVYSHGIFATREGLVGGTTANGHVIVTNDHFVALPSRRALSTNYGYQKQVRLTYAGRVAIVPVWDVGPWNTHDDYWNPPEVRETFNDLPRGMPESEAAFTTGYHGGTDERGRTVKNPAGIDLADGTFWIDLGMGNNDRIEVDFLWVDPPPPVPRRRAAGK